MPFVNVKILEGRTAEQKKRLVKSITESMAEICGCKSRVYDGGSGRNFEGSLGSWRCHSIRSNSR